MKLYVVIFNNGEEYEDYIEWVQGVMSTPGKAQEVAESADNDTAFFNRIEIFELDVPNEHPEWVTFISQFKEED